MKKRLGPVLLAALALGPMAGCTRPGATCEAGHCDNGDGTFTTTLDASDREAWVWFDLETASVVEVDEPTDSEAWDLGFMRFNIKTNGGDSGTGGMEVAIVDGKSLDEVTTVPDDGWVVDIEEDEDGDSYPDYAFLQDGAWYEYDLATHTLSEKDRTYVVRSVERNHYKIQVVDYYDEEATAGWVTFSWGQLPAAEGRW